MNELRLLSGVPQIFPYSFNDWTAPDDMDICDILICRTPCPCPVDILPWQEAPFSFSPCQLDIRAFLSVKFVTEVLSFFFPLYKKRGAPLLSSGHVTCAGVGRVAQRLRTSWLSSAPWSRSCSVVNNNFLSVVVPAMFVEISRFLVLKNFLNGVRWVYFAEVKGLRRRESSCRRVVVKSVNPQRLEWWLSAGWEGAPPHFIAHTTCCRTGSKSRAFFLFVFSFNQQ